MEAFNSARFEEKYVVIFSSPRFALFGWHLASALLVHLVAKHCEREGVRIAWSCVFNEALFPAVETFVALCVRDVVR